MDVGAYFESLSLELESVRDRVRQIIGGSHWQTHGEWRESVLRNVLRRHLPAHIGVGRGFVVNSHDASRQIDVLLYDVSAPILYRDGDLVIVTADAVRGIIEVKSNIRRSSYCEIFGHAADNAEFVKQNYPVLNQAQFSRAGRTDSTLVPNWMHQQRRELFVGVFAFETTTRGQDAESVFDAFEDVARGSPRRIINHVALGDSLFFRYWNRSPTGEPRYCRWHGYDLNRRAAGYFINNVVDSVSRSVRFNQLVWFPEEGKEIQRIGVRSFQLGNHR